MPNTSGLVCGTGWPRSADARFTVIACVEGKSNPQFRSADLIRSRLSFAAILGQPTTVKFPW
jgi:hypothetical protein